MVNALHAILSRIFGDSFADVAMTIIQWAAFAGVVYLVVAAMGLAGVSLPEGMDSMDALLVMLPLLIIASPNTVD